MITRTGPTFGVSSLLVVDRLRRPACATPEVRDVGDLYPPLLEGRSLMREDHLWNLRHVRLLSQALGRSRERPPQPGDPLEILHRAARRCGMRRTRTGVLDDRR